MADLHCKACGRLFRVRGRQVKGEVKPLCPECVAWLSKENARAHRNNYLYSTQKIDKFSNKNYTGIRRLQDGKHS